MITSTDRPNVIRVSFVSESTNTFESEIVCEVEVTDALGLKVWYLHHVIRNRPVGSGAWEPDQLLRHHVVSPALRALIRTSVMNEVASTFLSDNEILLRSDRVAAVSTTTQSQSHSHSAGTGTKQ